MACLGATAPGQVKEKIMHKNWCGKPCSQCITPCAVDESIPCSPDCTELKPDGSPGGEPCLDCDAIVNTDSFAGIMDKEEIILHVSNQTGWSRTETVRFLATNEYRVLRVLYDAAYAILPSLVEEAELAHMVPDRLFADVS